MGEAASSSTNHLDTIAELLQLELSETEHPTGRPALAMVLQSGILSSSPAITDFPTLRILDNAAGSGPTSRFICRAIDEHILQSKDAKIIASEPPPAMPKPVAQTVAEKLIETAKARGWSALLQSKYFGMTGGPHLLHADRF